MSRMTQLVLVVVLVSSAYAFVTGVSHKRLTTGDEGAYVTMALNMFRSAPQLVRPSFRPEGSAEWMDKDLGAMAHPPLFPALGAVGVALTGGHYEGAGLVNFLAFLVTLWFTFRLVGLWDPRGGRFAALLLAISPVVLWQFRTIECEPLVTAFGVAALYCFVRGELSGRLLCYVAGGALLGLGFLTKLWLIAPFVTAAMGLALTVRLGSRPIRWRLAPWIVAVAVFLVVASAHLVLVAILSPGDLSAWLRLVYFAVFTGAGVGGTKLSGAGVPADWAHPYWHYAVTLYRDHFFVWPFAALGLWRAFRVSFPRRGPTAAHTEAAPGESPECARGGTAPDERIMLSVLVGGLASLLVLSIPAVKDPLYSLTVAPFLYAAAGYGLSHLLRRRDAGQRPSRRVEGIVALGLAGLAGAVVIARVAGIRPDKLTTIYASAHGAGLAAVGLALWAATRLSRRRALVAIGGLAALALGGFVVYDASRPPLPHREVAELIRPYTAARPPPEPSFRAPNFRILQAYLFQAGAYWTSFSSPLDAGAIMRNASAGRECAFLLGEEEIRRDEMEPVRSWLALHTDDITDSLSPLFREHYRLFVNPACARTPGSAAGPDRASRRDSAGTSYRQLPGGWCPGHGAGSAPWACRKSARILVEEGGKPTTWVVGMSATVRGRSRSPRDIARVRCR